MNYSSVYYGRFSHYLRKKPDDVPLFRHITDRFRSFGTGRVLDVGCGLGYLLSWLSQQGWSGTGIDISDDALSVARTLYPEILFVRGSAYELPFEDYAFDAVVTVAVIEHLDNPRELLSQMVRVLKPGGMLIVSTPEVRSLYKKLMIHDPSHVHEFTREEITSLISEYGSVVDVTMTNMAGRLNRPLNDLIARLMPCDILVEARKAGAR